MLRHDQQNNTLKTVATIVGIVVVLGLLVFGFTKLLGGGGDGNVVAQAAGITGRSANFPKLPANLQAASRDYVVFKVEPSAKDAAVDLGLPLRDNVPTGGLGFYTYSDGAWQRVKDAVVVSPEKYTADGCVAPQTPPTGKLIACGDFTPVPGTLAVLAGGGQTYQVAGSVLAGKSLNPAAADIVTTVSPIDYRPANDGKVQGRATQLQLAQNQRLVPTISASSKDDGAVASDLVADPGLRRTHIEAIVALAKQGNFAGIDLEYTALDADAREGFAIFVKDLATALHQDNRTLSVALPATTNNGGPYDWKAIGLAADTVRVLPFPDPAAYWTGMPGALKFATEQVDRKKLLLVISPYSASKTGGQPKPIGYQEAMQIATKIVVRSPANTDRVDPGARVELAASNLTDGQNAGLRWSDDARAVTFAFGGDRGTSVFIENTFSVSFKLELVQSYGLAGISLLDASAGTDIADIWPAVRTFVTGGGAALQRPNGGLLIPRWEAPDGGDFSASSGPVASWTAPQRGGTFGINLVVSDGQLRFGRHLDLNVGEPVPSPTPTPSPTPASTPQPTPTATQAPSPSPTPTVTSTSTSTATATSSP